MSHRNARKIKALAELEALKHNMTHDAVTSDAIQNIHDHTEAMGASCSDASKHGAIHGKADAGRAQAIHDHSVNALGAECSSGEMKSFKSFKDYSDAMQPTWNGQSIDNPPDDVRTAAYAIASLCALLESEDDEPGDLAMITNTIRQLMIFIDSELKEAEAGEDPDDVMKKIPAVLRTGDDHVMNLSYVKSLGLAIPDSELAQLISVKAVNGAPDLIKHYPFIWGGKSITDVELEYFTKQSNLWDEAHGKDYHPPLTWDHAQDDDFKKSGASPVIGYTVEFGDDDLGRWAISKLDRAHKYRKMIDGLIERGVLGSSSDSAPQYIERERTGKSTWLKTWPWFATALTDIPAEPRMVGSLEFYKSLGVVFPTTEAPVNTGRGVEDLLRTYSILKLGE